MAENRRASALEITSRHNARIVELKKLAQPKHRRRVRRFRAEGLQMLQFAADSGVAPLDVFYAEDLMRPAARALLRRFARRQATLMPVSAQVLSRVADRERPCGIIATFPEITRSLDSIQLGRSDLVIVVDRPEKPANIGMLVRTADAVGARAVILLRPCADPFSPIAVRASMGSIFNVPLVWSSDRTGVRSWISRQDFQLVGADPHCGCDDWKPSSNRVALLLGAERRGISGEWRQHVDSWARLEIVGKAESLNVAVAGSILMYRWLEHRQQRRIDR